MSPKDALETFHLPPGFRIELAASEPEISDVVSIAFDERGRLWAVEMPDYPLNPKPLGRIKVLEDRDGDGRYERATIFAEGLHFPEGVLPRKKGILVASAPDILYLEDTDGDGRADVRRVVLTGFAQGNPQLRINNPLYGVDNWVYASYPRPPVPRRYVKEFGDTGSAIRFPDHPEAPAQDIHGMDVRFRLDPPQLEAIAGNSQFGNAFDSWGNHYTVWNNDHIREVVIQNHYLKQNPYLAVPLAQQSLSDHEKAAAVYPVTVNPFHIHDSQIGHFTSACGISVYTGGRFPRDFHNNSFTCEPVHNLVHRDVLVPNGATFTARRAYESREFLGSTDAWFRPVFTTVGPDGAMYVVDYYRFTVEHPEFVPPQLLKQIDFEARHRFGRIYRIVPEFGKPGPKPNLAQASAAELAAHLSDPNMWWRITAQRLLVERQDRSIVPQLEGLARQGDPAEARMHALWTLEGMGALREELILQALEDPTAGVREHAVRLAERRLKDPRFQRKVLKLADDPDDRVQFQAALTLGTLPQHQVLAALQKIALRHSSDSWFQIAVLTAAAENSTAWYQAMQRANADVSFLRRIASVAGARKKDGEIAAVLSIVEKAHGAEDAGWRVATLAGLADGLKQGSSSPLPLPVSQALLLKVLSGSTPEVDRSALRMAAGLAIRPSAELRSLLRKATAAAPNDNASAESRTLAIGMLGLDPTGSTLADIAKYLDPKQPEEIQIAAAGALGNMRSEKAGSIFIARWREATAKVRDAMVAWFFADRGRLPALLDAVQAGAVQSWGLGPARTQQLLRSNDPAVRARAQELLGENAQGGRKAVYEKYLPALTRKGDPERGRKVYERVCAECHKIGNTGFEVGPDLLTVTTHYKESLLADILMPNEKIEGGYEEYLIDTTDGRQITGILAKETSTTLTLRRRKGEEDTVLRSAVKSLRSLSVSPMPEDLEKSITIEQMADLIGYIKSLK